MRFVKHQIHLKTKAQGALVKQTAIVVYLRHVITIIIMISGQ